MDLNKKYGRKWRISLDESFDAEVDPITRKEKWRYYEIKGRHGMVYPYSENQLAVCVTSRVIAKRLSKKEGVVMVLDAECETVFHFPESDLDLVAGAIRARKKRRLSPEQRSRLIKVGEKGRQALIALQKARRTERLQGSNLAGKGI